MLTLVVFSTCRPSAAKKLIKWAECCPIPPRMGDEAARASCLMSEGHPPLPGTPRRLPGNYVQGGCPAPGSRVSGRPLTSNFPDAEGDSGSPGPRLSAFPGRGSPLLVLTFDPSCSTQGHHGLQRGPRTPAASGSVPGG